MKNIIVILFVLLFAVSCGRKSARRSNSSTKHDYQTSRTESLQISTSSLSKRREVNTEDSVNRKILSSTEQNAKCNSELFVIYASDGYQVEEITQNKYLPYSEGEVVHHSYYSLSYNEDTEQAEWVYYELTLPMVSGSQSRTDDFREDKKVSTGSAQLADYKGSGYDRGHLCPAGSMTHSLKAMSESFYMSNMSPQVPSFNQGRWKQLEKLVRSWVVLDSLLYVVSGPVLTDNMQVIGVNRVAVPLHYYKVIYSPVKSQMVAFLMPNDDIKEPVSNYTVTVDQIEDITDIDFFYNLPDSLELKLEASIDKSKWNFSSSTKIEKSSATNTNTSLLTTCLGVTKSGRPCKNNTKNINGYCHLHQSQVP